MKFEELTLGMMVTVNDSSSRFDACQGQALKVIRMGLPKGILQIDLAPVDSQSGKVFGDWIFNFKVDQLEPAPKTETSVDSQVDDIEPDTGADFEEF